MRTGLFALAGAVACALAVPWTARADVRWRSDFGTAGLRNFGSAHCGGTNGTCPCLPDHAGNSSCSTQNTDVPPTPSTGRFQTVPAPLASGETALRIEVRAGDNWHGLERNDLVENTEGGAIHLYREGEERYFALDLFFPSDGTFPDPPAYDPAAPFRAWYTLFQFHQVGNCYSVPLSISLRRTPGANGPYTGNTHEIVLTTAGGTYSGATMETEQWATPLNPLKGQWLHFVLHTRFSTDATQGLVELTMNDTTVVPLTHTATLYSFPSSWPNSGCPVTEDYARQPADGNSMPVFMAAGLYRANAGSGDGNGFTTTNVLYFKNMIAGTTAADVTGSGCTQTLCGTQCVNTQTDPNNCGTCGHACATGQTCAAGSCTTAASGVRVTGTDVNGDARGDFLARDSSGTFQIWTSNGAVCAQTGSYATYYTDATGWNAGNRFFPLDLDGDGRTDLIARGANGTFEVSLSNGSTFVPAAGFTTALSDANGWNGGNQFVVGDVTGDGLDDLLARGSNGTFYVMVSNGSALINRASFATPYTYAAGWGTGNRFYALDINGDARSDLLARGSDGGFDVWVSNGTTLAQTTSFATTFTDAAGWGSGDRFFVLDLNGDRRGDLLARGADGTFAVLLSNGSVLTTGNPGFATYFTDTAGWNSGSRFFPRDVDGDGMTDMMMRGGNGTFEVWLSNGAALTSGHPGFTTTLTDANGWASGLRFF